MIEVIKLWNEPNNLSHWDFSIDPLWKDFAFMIMYAAEKIKAINNSIFLILGGILPIDPQFVKLIKGCGVFENIDAVGVHGCPLDWNHWPINECPNKIFEIAKSCKLSVWVTEVGTSTFGDDEIQVFGLKWTTELLLGFSTRIFLYSLLDLPPTWEPTTKHKESDGSSYYRHFYMGLIRADGTPKPSLEYFNPELGICQWFHYEDSRLETAVFWLKKMGVKKLRTGSSWADWCRPDSKKWFDKQMLAIKDFDLTITFCFTPPSKGKKADITSPPNDLTEFANFACEVVNPYY